uniref:FBD domain-containing protein n=1 Tax=Ananas comosus var. bracteatus TaxID=296719 RepID=A0A6V7Q8H2_ANACO|nr:unnamed protein product [Ananas comosus var. bracteatus]
MRRLMVQDSEKLGTVVVADTPRLCRLFYWGDFRYLRVFERAAPKLEEAFLHSTVDDPFGGNYHLWKNLMQPLSHVRLLSVNWWFILDQFEQFTRRLSPRVVSSLLDFLKCCPNVQHLCIVSTLAEPWSPQPVVPSAEENEDEFLIKMKNSIDFNQTEGLQIVQTVPDIGQSLLPQLKKFTMFRFSGGLGDTCLLYFVG